MNETELQLTFLLDSLPQPVFTTNQHGLILHCNKAAEKLISIHSDRIINNKISELLQANEGNEEITDVIKNSGQNKIYKGQYNFKTAGCAECVANVSILGISTDSKNLTGTIIFFEDTINEKLIFKQLEAINKTLSSLTDNYLANVNKLTALCGELLGASSALYNRLNEGLLCSYGKWNTAPDHIGNVKPEGRICYDVIRNAQNEIYLVKNLPETSYANSDPNVLLYNLKTYIGHLVRCNGEPAGSLCVVFQHDYEYTENDRYIVRLLALAIEGEETRESLRRSTNRYRELFDLAVEGILTGSPDGIITGANNSITQMTGYTASELVGRHISEVMFTKKSIEKNPFRFDLLRENQRVISEREICCKDNRVITVEMHSKMMPDKTYQTVLYDISERKEYEKKLTESEITYRGIINSLNDSVYILDEEGNFLDVNTASEILYGYIKEEFIHKNPEFLSAPGGNDMSLMFRYIREAYNGEPAKFEFWGKRKDGVVFLKEISLTPGLWFGQEVVIAVGREITERKKAEEQLKISEEKYRLLVQYSSDPIFSFNPDETYRFVNEAFAHPFGKKPEEVIGKTPYDIFTPDEAEKRLRLVRQVFKTGEKGEIEVKIVTSDGNERFFITMVDPIKDTQGNIVWVTCISKDITLRKKAEEELKLKNKELQTSNAEKDKFFSILAHDLRGPMNGFLGLTGILADEVESLSADELKEIATTMRASADNVYRLIENLLEWSKMQRGTISFEPKSLFIRSSLTKSLELMKDSAHKKNIELLIRIPDPLVVFADIHMLETIFRNLVSNAIKFTYEGGSVEIAAEKESAEVIRFSIKDDGIGIGADLLDKLFLLTENKNRKGTRGEPSTGLGLMLCKEFVEKHGGRIWVESTEGKGSTFYFTLPRSC